MKNLRSYFQSLTFIFLLITLCSFCKNHSKSGPSTISKADSISVDSIKLHFSRLEKLYIVGDFTGDGIQDTISEYYFSNVLNTEIKSAPNPSKNEWDSIVKWFTLNDIQISITINNKNIDTLRLGNALGLYSLINIGDNNSDGKEEVALVVDYLDFSNVNSCKIYSMSKNKWTFLQSFSIHESAFNYSTSDAITPPKCNEIKDYLVKQNGIWVYSDYINDNFTHPEKFNGLQKLKVKKCGN